MRRVIFLNRYFHPDLSATSQLLSDLAFHLARQGFDVLVLTSRQRYDDANAALPREETVEGVRVKRLWSTRYGRAALLGRLFDYVSFFSSALVALLREPIARSVVVAKSDPPMISIAAAIATRLRGGAHVNWIQDFFPEIAEELGVIRKGGVLATLARWARDRSLRAARVNVVPGAGLATRVEQSGARARVIHNWADGTTIHPLEPQRNPLRRAWGLESQLVVAHSGNLGRAHDHETIVGAMRQLASNPRIQFLFIGGGSGYESLREEASRLGLSNVQFHPYQPRETLRESLGAADIHLISLHPRVEGLIVPSKFYGIAAAGRPSIYIGSAEGDIGRILTRFRCGLVVPSGDSAALARAIEDLADDRRRAEMGLAARNAFDEAFSDRIALVAWTRLLEEIPS